MRIELKMWQTPQNLERSFAMRAYNVNIVAVDEEKEVRFVEVIAFPLQALDRSGCVNERNREAGAIAQVKIKYPDLRDVRAEGSRHVSSDDFLVNYLPFPKEHPRNKIMVTCLAFGNRCTICGCEFDGETCNGGTRHKLGDKYSKQS